MRQKTLISSLAISTVGVGITSYLLKDKSSREKAKGLVRSAKMKITSFSRKKPSSVPIEKAGNPDPQDIEENRMVAEGSVYPVQYYNQNQQ
ncbi:hypothetical protein FZC66_05140 [Priestia megaterium]|nr:hypothetical protein FZC66_05140 [Priestia megaterium]